MIKRRPFHHSIYFKSKKRPITSTCAVPLDPQPTSNDHTSLFQSRVHDLLRRGLLSSAQQAIQRFIASSPTVPDAVFAIEFAAASGVDLGLGISCEILRKLVDLGEPLSAHDFYHDHLIARGIEPDSNIVNSMVICLAKLGKLDDAVKLFDRLIGSEDCVLSNAACTMILEGFYEQDKFLEAFDYFVRISDANVKLGMWIYNVLINGLCHQGYVGEAIQVFDIMCKNTGLPPTRHMFKTLFFGLCKKGWLVEAELVFEEMEVQGFFVDKVMYTSLMNAHGKNKKMKMAMRVYFRMLKKGCDPDIFTYNTLIHGFLKMGLFDKAWVLWNLMSDLGIQPNKVTYNLMICYYCKQGKLDCATMLLNSMVPCNLAPCVRSYTPIIAALYKQDKFLEAFDYFVRISDANVKLGMWIYNVLINGLCHQGYVGEAIQVFDIMCKNTGLPPTLHMFKTLFFGLCKKGWLVEAELVFEEMEVQGFFVDKVMYTSLMNAHGKNKKMKMAMRVYFRMLKKGCDPDIFTYNTLIHGFLKMGLFDKAWVLWNLMSDLGIQPNEVTYNLMICYYCKQGKLDCATMLLNSMVPCNLAPCVRSYTPIIAALYKQDKFLEAFDYFVRISDANVKLGMWIYNVLINGLCHQGYVGEAIQVFDIMCKNTGLPPTLHMFKTLFFGLCKKGWLVEAELVFEEMEVQGFFVDKVMYTSLMNAHGKNKKMKMAMRVYFRMLKKGCDPDICTYNTLIHGFLKMGLFDKAWVLWNLMSDLGIQPNEVTYNLMICYYCKQGKLDCATMLLNSMVPCNLAPCVRSYTPIIAALYKQNRCLEVDEMCERMLESGIIPDHVLFFVLMKNEPKGLELQLCLLMLQAIAKNGCGLDHSSLSNFDKINSSAGLEQEIELILREITRIDLNLCNVAGSIYVSALCEGGKTEAALACFKNVASAGCIPLLFTFNSLIKRLFQDGRFEDVKSLFEIMQNEGIVPNLETYLIMVNEYCKQEDLASAFWYFGPDEGNGSKT
ncbi:hypothetical protein OIU84_007941 [Salix udensis]|uniref:Pentatricopeptide repeat-containing protein n=1 Tax=Salix udensis TaxID=889485 RepID=A0AAD6JTY8_9ROSI|nr:hypothetical protein OIU84_007941 [Salix udensis]